jgi:[acyl-carrier-protein] S-malonyltransferase
MSDTALLFPGQGAQSVGMGHDLADQNPEARALFDQANDVLGFDLTKICFDGPEEELTRSHHAQPAIFLVSAAAYAVLKKQKPDLQPAALAGLSSGEWAALYAAGAVSFEDTLRVLEARGRFMQSACEQQPGGMLSVIGLTLDQLTTIAEACEIQVANLNSAEQTVLSGTLAGVEKAEAEAKATGAKRAIRLNVAGAFHSRLMAPAAAQLADFLADIPLREPAIPVVSNVNGKPFQSVAEIRELMVRQVTESVRWVDDVQWMLAQGITRFVECGPGKVLAGLVKRIDKTSRILNIQDQASLTQAVAQWEA